MTIKLIIFFRKTVQLYNTYEEISPQKPQPVRRAMPPLGWQKKEVTLKY